MRRGSANPGIRGHPSRWGLIGACLALGACRPPVAAIAISPASLALNGGDSIPVHVDARDAVGNIIAASVEHPTGIEVTWTSTDPSVVSVAPTALERAWRPEAVVTALKAGSARVIARCCGGKSSELSVTVRGQTAP